ncbi:DNase I-like protein [Aspergillus campestris IBT 28561]|uniref:DNase I-like protein n=1 Tax=Aspergillus campestris (strain IBT 28561) TaxID=1392248 RepID=A0A2I1DFN6_ASPC2|nr:DNase I-like protein [Aspergillus campestris IBT 28561]PKY08686.1 DNase I-like protein [Aspergillus campestris IBT 28561]
MEKPGEGKESADNAPIRPVSSLLSHFENLTTRRPSPSAQSRDSLSVLKSSEPTDDFRARASLDLPRSRSPWASTSDLQHDDRSGFVPTNGYSARNSGSPGRLPGRRQSRPMSMNFRSSPQLAPTLTVDSPRSPPRELGSPVHRDHDFRTSRSPGNHVRDSLPAIPQRPFNRAISPMSASSVPTEQKVSHLSPSASNTISVGEDGMSGRKLKSASLPPPANRAAKPKIPAKPAALAHQDGGCLAPRSERAVSEERVSPFSTPPSSPEKSPKQLSTSRASTFPHSLSQPERPSPSPLIGRGSPAPPIHTMHSARESSLSRPSGMFGAPQPPVHSKPLMVHIPQGPSVQPRSLASAPTAGPPLSNRLQAIDSPYERPGLPPRRRASRSPSRPASRLEPAYTGPVSRPGSRAYAHGELQTPSQVQRQPSFSRDTKPGVARPLAERPSVEPPVIEQPVVGRQPVRPIQTDEGILRVDYPDTSCANRRPPVLKSGPREINTRYDTRLMDVCGKHVCTTGYLTRVWDLTDGEQILSLSHGETVKSLSIAFKPGTGLEDEGQRLWLGTSAGELHEVDIPTRAIVASRSYPSRREVIKILRHKKEMWTLDDEGRLLVWPPDESGTPQLQYSYHNPYDRVARGHTFSMVVGDTLWLATGKDVHIYRPNAADDVSFRVLQRPLGAQHTGEVTSGAYTTKHGGRVYLGHADGKVTIYSSADYACLAVVNVSVYKINCLGIVGDYLWAGYKTGMIYVYDTTTNPWTVKKDWIAHDSPVSQFLLDCSSVWTMNRLQVTSLGLDNCIRSWDGMLEDDWLDSRMQNRDFEYCKFREINAVIMTWNAGASTPGSVRTTTFIQDAIRPDNPPEILVFGFQELVDLENKKITAKSLLMGSKKKETGEKEHMSRQYRVWMEHLTRCINECMPLDESYVLLHSANLIGLFTCIFVKHKERHRIKGVNAAEVKRGMGGLHGNKGALIFRFILDDTSLCFVNCHLAAGQTQTANRNNDIAGILEAESLPAEHSPTARLDHFVSGGDGSMIMDHEICVLNGDLNYRIDSIPRNVIIEAIRNNNLAKLLDRDQLLASRRKNPGFRLRSFNEAPITFAPTYKYDVGTDEYDSSDKKRSPAWCDRILYRGLGRIKQYDYRRLEVRASDHRPVTASFKFRIKTILPEERTTAWETSQQDFQVEKRRLASEASIEYLIGVLGTDPKQARALILGAGA